MSLRNWDNLEQTDQTIDMVLAHFVDWTASHFSRLDSHTNIRMINIGEGSIVGVKSESIGEFPNLERVYFYCVELDSDAVRALGRMPKLHSVQFRNCWLPDDTFELLGQSSSIVELNVTQTAHSSAFTRGLSKLEGVTSLVLDETDFNDSDCAHLQGHSTLENLYMTSTEVTESTIDTLLTIPNLTEVRIKGTWISQDDKKRLHQAGIKCNR